MAKELADHERAHSGQPGMKVRHGADATGKVIGQKNHGFMVDTGSSATDSPLYETKKQAYDDLTKRLKKANRPIDNLGKPEKGERGWIDSPEGLRYQKENKE